MRESKKEKFEGPVRLNLSARISIFLSTNQFQPAYQPTLIPAEQALGGDGGKLKNAVDE